MRKPLNKDEVDFYLLAQHWAPYVLQPQFFISCIGTEGSDPEGDLYVPPMLMRDYRPGDTIKVPVKNLSLCDVDLKMLSPSRSKKNNTTLHF